MRAMTEQQPAGTVVLVQDTGAAAVQGDGTVVPVPSGQVVTFLDVVMDTAGPEGLTARFRFVAPAIAKSGGSIDAATASADMQVICDSFALPRLSNLGPKPSQIVISLSDKPVPFGQAAPDATQFFEAYSIDGDACIWEAF